MNNESKEYIRQTMLPNLKGIVEKHPDDDQLCIKEFTNLAVKERATNKNLTTYANEALAFLSSSISDADIQMWIDMIKTEFVQKVPKSFFSCCTKPKSKTEPL